MTKDSAGPRRGILRRAAGNAGMLLGGKGAAGLMQLATFALAARGLGVTEFGVFSVLIAQVMLFTGLAAFDSNQAVIRYGVLHLNSGDHDAIQRLFKAGTVLDLLAAAAAALCTIVAAPFVGDRLGWDAGLVGLAQAAAPLAFVNAISTQKGILRLLGRFDLLSVHATITPALRLATIGTLSLIGASLAWYVAAWVLAGAVGAVAAIFLAWREARRRRLLGGWSHSLRNLSQANRGVWRFSLMSNLNSTMTMIPTHLAVLIVAALLGEAAAGLFRIGREFGAGLIKPVELVNQAVYPDISRLVAARSWRRLWTTGLHAGLVATALGTVVSTLVIFAGPWLVHAIFGAAFVAAVPLIVAIGYGTAIRMLAIASDPVLYAVGRPGTALLCGAASSAAFVALLVWRLPIDGLLGAGWAFVGMGILAALLGISAAIGSVRAEARRQAVS